ncbi:MAG: hypothetical protein HXY40_04030 [Chloroflexi bacterium]|nr:hypothetical protein [Chloroflexota bacterium]
MKANHAEIAHVAARFAHQITDVDFSDQRIGFECASAFLILDRLMNSLAQEHLPPLQPTLALRQQMFDKLTGSHPTLLCPCAILNAA